MNSLVKLSLNRKVLYEKNARSNRNACDPSGRNGRFLQKYGGSDASVYCSEPVIFF